MSEALYIVTGASRGMGAAIAEQLLDRGTTVLGISRGINESLSRRAAGAGATLAQWQRDLSQPVPIARELSDWLARRDGTRFASATLINNAGVIPRIGPVDDTSPEDLSNALRVGLEAAVLLTAAFLRGVRAWPAIQKGEVKVLNISSGLGRRAMAGSAPYCAAKAGMDHFTRALALDEAHRGHGAKVVSLAPGVIDTEMQTQLRGADPAGFPDKAMFEGLRSSGQLLSPVDAAARVIAYLRRPDFGSNPVGDVRE